MFKTLLTVTLSTLIPVYGQGVDVRMPLLSANPTAVELESLSGLPQGLIAIQQENDSKERIRLAAILNRSHDLSSEDGMEEFDKYTREHPQSPWVPSLLINLASLNYTNGKFSKAMSQWKLAWETAERHDTPAATRLKILAKGKYAATQVSG